MWKNIKGFTLIELMICIMILAIMAIMGVTVVGNLMAWKSADNNSNAVIIQQQDEKTESRY
jgi:prepilin-type N-terminal cleavage/methylation domain-containing protein